MHVGLSWYCDDNCVYENERRLAAKSKPNARRTVTEPSTQKKKFIRDRDGNSCRCCGAKRPLHVHHINYRSEGGGHHETNLISLCSGCHDLVHSDKRRWKRLLLGVIWEHYVSGRFITAIELERWLASLEAPTGVSTVLR